MEDHSACGSAVCRDGIGPFDMPGANYPSRCLALSIVATTLALVVAVDSDADDDTDTVTDIGGGVVVLSLLFGYRCLCCVSPFLRLSRQGSAAVLLHF